MARLIRLSQRRLDEIIGPQGFSPTGVFSCNFREDVFVPTTYGLSDERYERIWLTNHYPELHSMVCEVLKRFPKGGRFEVTSEGAFHRDTGKQVARFQIV